MPGKSKQCDSSSDDVERASNEDDVENAGPCEERRLKWLPGLHLADVCGCER